VILNNVIRKIISGGQTGADRAALDWAIANGVSHGGWCPAGRRAEDGTIPDVYQLTETPNRNYLQRTTWNVRDSDGTLIISMRALLSGGSKATQEIAVRIGRPCLHVFPGASSREIMRDFVEKHAIKILNVAGPRESNAPGIGGFVMEVLTGAALLEVGGDGR
jgi:hypothetical protein